jgi:hypothetical protein
MRIKCIVAPLVAVTALGLLAACESSGASEWSTLGVGYFQSATIGPEVLVAGNPELADKVDGTFKLTPIDSGVAGLAQLRGGAFPFVSGVGNPPVVGSIAQNTQLKVIYAEYFDAAQLIVGPDITANDQLAGKTVGDLQGSSEDFEIRGWLEKQGLTDKTKVVGFPSEAAVAAAFKAHKIDGAGPQEERAGPSGRDGGGDRQAGLPVPERACRHRRLRAQEQEGRAAGGVPGDACPDDRDERPGRHLHHPGRQDGRRPRRPGRGGDEGHPVRAG